jgi:uncharacterized hydrophobic protein (TIGR00271 family)
MIHLRVVSPVEETDAVLDLLERDAAVINVTVVRGAARQPRGDLVTCDLARESANAVVAALRERGLHRRGSIALEHIDLSLSDVAAEAERVAPGLGTDAAVWEEVDARVRDDAALSIGFLVFIVIAALIGAVGLVEDSPVLVVGAMVVGPEFGPIAGLAVGLYKRRAARVRQALVTLVAGFATATAAAYLGTLAAEAAGLLSERFDPSSQPLTGFVVDPSVLSFVVAFLAGIVGTLSLTQAKAGALVGVLISVTTIPAIAAAGVAGAVGEWHDARGAGIQLALNVVALTLAGVLTLWAQREAWERVVPGVRGATDRPYS